MPDVSDFLATYKPVRYSESENDLTATLLENYHDPEVVDIIQSAPINRVWTLCDENGFYVVPGIRFVNRMGYFIATVDRLEDDDTVYQDEEDEEEDEYEDEDY